MDKLNDSEVKLLHLIRNTNKHFGFNPSLRKLMINLGYKSPRSVSLMISLLIEKGYIKKTEDGILEVIKELPVESFKADIVDVPVLGSVSCGNPLLAIENPEKTISISTSIVKPPYKYFILKAYGNSMNLSGIEDGMYVLIRQQQTAKNGDIVVALIRDECLLKIFYRADDYIILKPHSSDENYKTIILKEDFSILGIKVSILPDINL